MSAYHVVIVDDEKANLEPLDRILSADGASVTCFEDPKQVIPYISRNKVDVLLVDFRMSGMTGIEVLQSTKQLDATIQVIMMTAYGTVELAVEAMKAGAYDFVTKPLQRIQVIRTVHKALEKKRLLNENQNLREALKVQNDESTRPIIRKSSVMNELVELVDQAAASKATVLIEGESGTGKGVVAKYLHEHSVENGIFVKINCTAIPENLLEAELFGYEAGAFTGANRTKKGRVELAQGGTLFLDEIGIAPPSLQAKLLRFVQEGEFERLGSNQTRKVDTRVVSATNANLEEEVKKGTFREDLFYRLNVIRLRIPPLRERPEDIELLSQHFIEASAKKNGRKLPNITFEASEALKSYSWPGNIRELENIMERLVVLDRKGTVGVEDLPAEIRKTSQSKSILIPIGTPLREIEKLVLDRTLLETRGDKRQAARLLGVHPRTVYRHLGLDPSRPKHGPKKREPEAMA